MLRQYVCLDVFLDVFLDVYVYGAERIGNALGIGCIDRMREVDRMGNW
jgi:hypothetical protein